MQTHLNEVRQIVQRAHGSFNEARAEEVAGFLQEKGHTVSVEKLGDYLQQQGIVVDISIGRKRMEIPVAFSELGLQVQGEENQQYEEFFKKHIKNAKLTFLAESIHKKLEAAEGFVRKLCARKAVGYGNKFLLLSDFEEFAQKFEEKRQEYFALIENTALTWEQQKEQFRQRLNGALANLSTAHLIPENVLHRILGRILSRVPSAEEFRESAYFDMNLSVLPLQENASFLPEAYQKEVNRQTRDANLNIAYEAMAKGMADAFRSVNLALKNATDHELKLTENNKKQIRMKAERMRETNLVANPMIDRIADKVAALAVARENFVEDAEEVMALLYGYTHEIGELASYKADFEKGVIDQDTLSELYGIFRVSLMH